MNSAQEVRGATERPADSNIDIVEGAGGSVIITIPPPRHPWMLVTALAAATGSLIAALIVGLQLFIFNDPSPVVRELIGNDIHDAPPAAKLIALASWLAMLMLSGSGISLGLRPLVRRETIRFAPEGLHHSESSFGRSITMRYPYAEIIGFRDRQDRRKMIESNLVIRIAGADERWPDEHPMAQSTTEAEKQWLTSALNVLLGRFKQT